MNEQTPQNQPQIKRAYWKFVAVFLVIIILAGGGFFVWNKYFSPEAKSKKQAEESLQKYLDWQKKYEDAMKADTYGGKTPEETLNMFIDALKKGDVELASRYFILRDDGNPNPEWRETLTKIKESNKLLEIINALLQTKPDPEAVIGKDYYVLSARDKNGVVIADVDLRFNKFSGVWKIESM